MFTSFAANNEENMETWLCFYVVMNDFKKHDS